MLEIISDKICLGCGSENIVDFSETAIIRNILNYYTQNCPCDFIEITEIKFLDKESERLDEGIFERKSRCKICKKVWSTYKVDFNLILIRENFDRPISFTDIEYESKKLLIKAKVDANKNKS